MDFDAIRRVASMKPPGKKPPPKAPEPSKPPAAPPPNPTLAPPPPGPPQGPYMEEIENVPGDPRFGFMEHSRTWKLGFNPNYTDNYSYQDYPAPQEYYNYHENPGMNSRENSRQIDGYPGMNFRGNYRQIDGYPGMNSRGNYRQIDYYPDDHHHDCHQSRPGYGTISRGRGLISARPPRPALPPPDRYMVDYNELGPHHGNGTCQSSSGVYYSAGNRLSPPVREFGPGARGPPSLIGPPPLDPYHFSEGPPRGGSRYYTPTNCENYFSEENPNACSIM